MKTIFKHFEQCISLDIHNIEKIKFDIAKWVLVIAALITMAPSCDKTFLEDSTSLLSGGDVNSNLEYYKGAIPNSYYKKNYNGVNALRVTGKPFMVVKYDRTTHHVLDFEFGLSEVTQTAIRSPGAPPEPTLNASSIDCQKKLNLVSPVVLLVNYPATAWGGTVTNGSLGAGGVFFTFSGDGTKYSFSYLPAGIMTGGAVDLDGAGNETDAENSFNMLKQ